MPVRTRARRVGHRAALHRDGPTRRPGRTRLILLCGLPGSGKTTLARRLADEVRAVRLRSDRDEKRLAARVLGAAVELHYLDVPTDVFEPPEPDELALFDAPPRRNANPRPGEVR